jgi:hypothetical protein
VVGIAMMILMTVAAAVVGTTMTAIRRAVVIGMTVMLMIGAVRVIAPRHASPKSMTATAAVDATNPPMPARAARVRE